MATDPKVKTSIYLPSDVHWKLKEEAVKRRVTETNAMEEAIRNWLGEPEPKFGAAGPTKIGLGGKNAEFHAKLDEVLAGDPDNARTIKQLLGVFTSGGIAAPAAKVKKAG